MTKKTIRYIDWKSIDYKEAWGMQQAIFDNQIEAKKQNKSTENTLIFVEHPHVFTLGKSGDRSNMLISDEMLKKIDATYYHIDRGGDITYHGPGQIVGYPIFDLENLEVSYKEFIDKLELGIINYLKHEHNINAYQMPKATGVWIDQPNGQEKICAIGTRASKYITMHGFALNINTQLKYFDYINPCGYTDKKVISLEVIKKQKQNIEQEKIKLKQYIIKAFGAEQTLIVI